MNPHLRKAFPCPTATVIVENLLLQNGHFSYITAIHMQSEYRSFHHRARLNSSAVTRQWNSSLVRPALLLDYIHLGGTPYRTSLLVSSESLQVFRLFELL